MNLLPSIERLHPKELQALFDLAHVQLTLETLREDPDWATAITCPDDRASKAVLEEFLGRAAGKGITPDESPDRIREVAEAVARGVYLKPPTDRDKAAAETMRRAFAAAGATEDGWGDEEEE